MARAINPRIDALFVEGPDDGAVVNALVKKLPGIEFGRRPYLVRTREPGGGSAWALGAFDRYVASAPDDARVGLIIDRDGSAGRPDNWEKARARLLDLEGTDDGPRRAGHIIHGRFGVWLWPDNVTVGGALEDFVSGIVPPAPVLAYATEVSRIAKEVHGAEYDPGHARKAALKVRSVWCDASAAGGYGHLIRNLPLAETRASQDFLKWFQELFLT